MLGRRSSRCLDRDPVSPAQQFSPADSYNEIVALMLPATEIVRMSFPLCGFFGRHNQKAASCIILVAIQPS